MSKLIAILLLIFLSSPNLVQEKVLLEGKGSVSFSSTAPQEKITATSTELKGILDLTNQSFAFSFPVNSFNGFNSPLQKEHFKEHYLESSKYPTATYVGKILKYESCMDCEVETMTKGKLSIHGVTQVITVPSMIKISNGSYGVKASFEVRLADFGIDIPLILEGKIAPVVNVSVDIILKKDEE